MASISYNTNQSQGSNYGYGVSGSEGQSTGSNQSQNTASSNSQSQSVSGPDPGLMQRWDTGYKNAIDSHTALHDQMLQGYSDVLARVGSQADRVQAGYQGLSGDVLGRIQGIDSGRRQDIADTYARQRGSAGTDLTSRGLGNTTVKSAVDRGLQYDQQKALNSLSNQTAGMQASYMSNLGSQGLAAQSQAQGQMGQLGGQYMGNLSSYLLQPLGWAPNRSDSSSTSTSQSQGTSSGQNQSTNRSWGENQNTGQNSSNSYGYSMQSNPPQYGGGGYGGYPPISDPYNPGGSTINNYYGDAGGGGDWGDPNEGSSGDTGPGGTHENAGSTGLDDGIYRAPEGSYRDAGHPGQINIGGQWLPDDGHTGLNPITTDIPGGNGYQPYGGPPPVNNGGATYGGAYTGQNGVSVYPAPTSPPGAPWNYSGVKFA